MCSIFSKTISKLILVAAAFITCYFAYALSTGSHEPAIKTSDNAEQIKLKLYSAKALEYCKQKNFNTSFCFLIDMSLHSGKKRFFVYDMQQDSLITSGMVAHGSCNESFLASPKFSNTPGSGCTSVGRYKVKGKYTGRFGIAYKLYGLDSSNSNAYKRNVVLHSYYMMPDNETYPAACGNSLGCAMVSDNFIKTLAQKIDSSAKPILLWIFE